MGLSVRKPIFIECTCHDHAIVVEHDDHDMIWVTLWNPSTMRQANRLRQIWWILKGKGPLTNECVLSRNDADNLIVALDGLQP